MSEANGDTGPGPEMIFEGLRDRPAPELDSSRLWRGIEAGLQTRRASLWARLLAGGAGAGHPGMRLAFAAVAMAVLALAVWTLFVGSQPVSPQFVLLTPAEAPGGAAPAVDDDTGATGLRLDVRLVRGYDGAAPADVRSAQSLGVGGADALLDVRSRIEALLPFADFGVVGAWQGEVTGGDALDLALSDAYRLVARSTELGDGSVLRLDGIELDGIGGEPVSGNLSLQPGRLYILGVPAPGAEHPELVLLLRARAGRGEGR
jgi:hypothetical protein